MWCVAHMLWCSRSVLWWPQTAFPQHMVARLSLLVLHSSHPENRQAAGCQQRRSVCLRCCKSALCSSTWCHWYAWMPGSVQQRLSASGC